MGYKTSEKAGVENPCVKYARDRGVKVLKINPLWAVGWPDRMFMIPGGRPLLVEFKRPSSDSKLTPNQEKTIGELKKAGYDVHVINNKADGIALLRARLEAAALHEARDEVGAGAPVRRAVSRPRPKKN